MKGHDRHTDTALSDTFNDTNLAALAFQRVRCVYLDTMAHARIFKLANLISMKQYKPITIKFTLLKFKIKKEKFKKKQTA